LNVPNDVRKITGTFACNKVKRNSCHFQYFYFIRPTLSVKQSRYK